MQHASSERDECCKSSGERDAAHRDHLAAVHISSSDDRGGLGRLNIGALSAVPLLMSIGQLQGDFACLAECVLVYIAEQRA